MSANSYRGARGEAEFAFVFIFILFVCGGLGFLLADGLNIASCSDYGKARFLGKVYECKKAETKK